MNIRKLRIVGGSAALVVAGFGISQQANGQIAINGTIDPAFGTPLAYSQVPSSVNGEAQAAGFAGAPGSGNTDGFADGTDIEASYATIRANAVGVPTLYMFFAGNLSSGLFYQTGEPNGSTPLGDFLNVFVQTGTGGLNTLANAGTLGSADKFQHMVGTVNPITFDSGFAPNYRLSMQDVGGSYVYGGGGPGDTNNTQFDVHLNYGNLNTNTNLYEGTTKPGGTSPVPTGSTDTGNGGVGSSQGINFSVNNSNTQGVTGTSAPSQSAQAAISTGVEMQIPLADLIESGQTLSAGSPIKIGYMTMQGNNNPVPYADDISNQITNLAPGYIDNTGAVSIGNNTNVANGTTGSDATKTANAGLSLNLNNQPGGQHYFVINNVANLTWNNAGGSGTGTTWDAAAQNFNDGTNPAVYSDNSLVTFNDSNNSHYNVALNSTVTPGSVTVNSSSNYTFSGSGHITGGAAFQNLGTGTTTLSTVNSYTGGTLAAQGTLVIGAAGALPANSKLTVGTTGFETGDAIVATAGVLQLAPGTGVETLSSLTVNGANPAMGLNTGSTLDITNNHLFIDYGSGTDPIAAIAAEIKSGFNPTGTPWTGTGITSTTAMNNAGSYGIGYADSADPGNPAGLASGTIEIKYTLLGDANLDGAVNGSDFAILATNFNKAVSGWDAGDFNYDGAANGADFAALASNFNKGASQADVDSFALASGLTADVPEPASIGLAAAGIVSLLGRRRRRN